MDFGDRIHRIHENVGWSALVMEVGPSNHRGISSEPKKKTARSFCPKQKKKCPPSQPTIYELNNKPLEHTPPVISEDSLHNHLGICSEGLLVRSWKPCFFCDKKCMLLSKVRFRYFTWIPSDTTSPSISHLPSQSRES